MAREPWSRSEILTLAGLAIAIVACVAALLVVPEVRSYLTLDSPLGVPPDSTDSPRPPDPGTPVPTRQADVLPYAGVRRDDDRLSGRTFALRPDEIDAARQGLIPYHGFMDDQALSSPQPVYSGSVSECTSLEVAHVEIRVDELGTVTSARENMVCKELSEALEAAALATRFPPAVVDGRRVGVWGSLRYRIRQR